MNRQIAALFFCLMFGSFLSKAQESYVPDTSLTYPTFLRQCQEFTTRSAEKIWVVNFWASFNTPSLYSIPRLKQLNESYEGKPIRFVSISVDKNRDAWKNALMRFKMPWEQLILPSDEEYAFLRKAFKHRSFPAIFVVHLDGRIERVVDAKELQLVLSNQKNLQPDEDDIVIDEGIDDEQEYLEHEVVSGETLYSLQQKYKVKWQEIKKFNKLPNTRIKPGQILKIPQ
ncbi:MAG: LysM peptidoglycan-binding domain-containing protein [Bacteroidia bacterium]|nr:LysM peptidoglycan-binding domain-containing protein [Bacteroidia bacterium]